MSQQNPPGIPTVDSNSTASNTAGSPESAAMDSVNTPDQPAPSVELDLTDLPPVHDDIPEDSVPLSPSEQHHQQLNASTAFNPPAHLAARFYRPSAAAAAAAAASRRKSSATSSRRNSLSSQQSMQSNSSYRQACRSNSVAQYLRRASIIESRKARLAAREAHAEQVRLRAALARTAPRSSNSEERAIAAKQAREERLAQVAATCAEEVRRAKRIAEETKERRAAEEERSKLEMEEKHKEAEKRRLEFKRNNVRRPRTASSPLRTDIKKAAIKIMSEEEKESAVRCLQRTWRSGRRKIVLDNFLAHGLSIDKVHDTTFEDIRALLCDDEMLIITTKVLELLGLQAEEGKGNDRYPVTRTFLTAYLLLGHPTQVMNQDGDQEQSLIQKAKDVIISFEAAVSGARAQNHYMPSPTRIEEFQLAHSAYLTTFADWKTRDKTILIELLLQDFINLDAIWQSVKDDTDGQVADDYHHAIRENQVHLLCRLRKLAGPERASVLVRKAIRDSRRQKALRKKPAGAQARPRIADMKIHANPSSDVETDPVVEPAAQLTPSLRVSGQTQTSCIANVFSVMPSNRVITHELVMDKEYRIDFSQQTELRDEVHRKICDSMHEAFQKGEGDRWTVATAENVRAKLLQLMVGSKSEGSLWHLISEALNPDMIQQQCAAGQFSYQNFFNFIATILPKLCAPVRDEEVRQLSEDLKEFGSLEEMIEKLFKLFHVIDVLALDYSNFLLSNVAARLIKEAPGYEQRLFAKDIAEGKHNLTKTRRWWNNASVNVLTEADRLDPTYRPTVQKIYARGLVDLAIAAPPLREADVPETLELDTARLTKVREQSVRIALIGSILLGAKNLLKRDVRAQWKSEAARMWDALSRTDALAPANVADATPARLLAAIESSHVLPPATRSSLLATITRLVSQAAAGRLTDPVAKVLFGRLRTHVFARLAASSSGERVRAVSTASESLAAAGLPECAGFVGTLVDVMSKVSDVDRRAHGSWYERIASEGEREGGQGASDETKADGEADNGGGSSSSAAAASSSA